MGQELIITAPHAAEIILKAPPDKWITNARLTHYQTLLLNPQHVKFTNTMALNPATLLPDDDPSQPIHDCLDILSSFQGSRSDLRDTPWMDPEEEIFTDGSSFMVDGIRYAGATVVTLDKVIWAQELGHGTSAQKAELIALTQALRFGKNKTVNIYTDSRYAFATAHVHGAIYKERGLLTSRGKIIKNVPEILALLEAIWLPKRVAIMHCKAHQKGETTEAQGNNFADQTAKEASLRPVGPLTILPALPERILPSEPVYSEQDNIKINQLKAQKNSEGWAILPNHRLYLPEDIGRELVHREPTSARLR